MSWLERTWYPESTARASPAALPLALLSVPFRMGVALRGAAYDAGLFRATKVEGAKVVSVGNLQVGGAGKTPVVIFLATWALAAGRRVAVLSRGYGRTSGADVVFDGTALPELRDAGDEPRLIARRCPQAKLYVGADRARLAVRARAEGADFLLLDDGFQHRRLARDVDLVVLDAQSGFGNGHLLPWGPLREPRSALLRAGLVWLKSTDGQGLPAPREAKRVVRARHVAASWVDPTGVEQPLDALRDRRVVALAGLARPGGFLNSLGDADVHVVASHLFPDHHAFTAEELQAARVQAAGLGAEVACTEKDAERLPPTFAAWKLRLGVQVLEGLESLATVLELPVDRAPRQVSGG